MWDNLDCTPGQDVQNLLQVVGSEACSRSVNTKLLRLYISKSHRENWNITKALEETSGCHCR